MAYEALVSPLFYNIVFSNAFTKAIDALVLNQSYRGYNFK